MQVDLQPPKAGEGVAPNCVWWWRRGCASLLGASCQDADAEELGAKNVEMIRCILEETNTCYFWEAPVLRCISGTISKMIIKKKLTGLLDISDPGMYT